MMKKSRRQVCLNLNMPAISPCGRYATERRQRAQQKPPEDRHRVTLETQQCRSKSPTLNYWSLKEYSPERFISTVLP